MLTDDLLELQRIDTAIDQLSHRRAHLPEREAAAAAGAEADTAERRRTELTSRNGELDAAVADLEREGEALTALKARLEGQLKTVIAPREAEALMHELDTVAHRRDELDDRELADLEEQTALVGELAELDERMPALRSGVDTARDALAAAEAVVEGELSELRSARTEVAARIGADLVARYDQLRTRFGGVAVARLEGSRCGGCHLNLSTNELAAVRATPDGQFAECPQCGRLLVA